MSVRTKKRTSKGGTAVWLPPAELERLRIAALIRGVDMSAFVSEAVEASIEKMLDEGGAEMRTAFSVIEKTRAAS